MSDDLLTQIKGIEREVQQLTSRRAELEGRRSSLQEQRSQLMGQLNQSLGRSLSLTELHEYLITEKRRIEASIGVIKEKLESLTRTPDD